MKKIFCMLCLISFTYASNFYKLYFEWKGEATIKEKYENESKLKLFLKNYLKSNALSTFPTNLNIPFKDAFLTEYIYKKESDSKVKIISKGADGILNTKDDVVHEFTLSEVLNE